MGGICFFVIMILSIVIVLSSFVEGYRMETSFIVDVGGLENSDLRKIAKELGHSTLSKSLMWLASNIRLTRLDRPCGMVLQVGVLNEQGKRDPVLFSTGFAETFIKYADLLRQLVKQGHPVYTFDLRGQGFSGESAQGGERAQDRRIVHLESIDEYTGDLEALVHDVVFAHDSVESQRRRRRPLHYIGSSTGALIGLLLQSRTGIFGTMVLSAPCIMPAGVTTLARFGVGIMMAAGKASDPVVKFRNSPRGDVDNVGVDVNSSEATSVVQGLVSHDVEGLRAWRRLQALLPQVRLGGPSMGWAWHMTHGGDHLRRAVADPLSLESKHLANTNILLFQAGVDTFVDNGATSDLWNMMMSLDGPRLDAMMLLQYPESYHEVLYESEEIRATAIPTLLRYLTDARSVVRAGVAVPRRTSAGATPVSYTLASLHATGRGAPSVFSLSVKGDLSGKGWTSLFDRLMKSGSWLVGIDDEVHYWRFEFLGLLLLSVGTAVYMILMGKSTSESIDTHSQEDKNMKLSISVAATNTPATDCSARRRRGSSKGRRSVEESIPRTSPRRSPRMAKSRVAG